MPAEPLDAATSRQAAVVAYNAARGLSLKSTLTVAELDDMIHAAHASRYHWAQAEETAPVNLARGEWLCSRVYAVAGRSEAAIFHGRRCLEILEEHNVGDWDLVCAHEALARGYALARDEAKRSEHLARAHACLDLVADPEDRVIVEADVLSVPEIA